MATARRRSGRARPESSTPRGSSRQNSSGPSARTRPDGKLRAKGRARSRTWTWIRRLLLAGFSATVLAVALALGALWYLSRDLPDVDRLRHYHPPQVTRIVDRHGEIIGEAWQERRTVVPIARVPRVLVLSVLAAEDADFYRHEGLDYPGLVRAVFRGLVSGGKFRGTSTITQQVIKNLLLSPERSYSRKIRELLLSRRLEQELTKEEILELYLNHVNFGHGRYGVQEASQFYFGKDVDELSLAEASLLAGIPQSPTHLSPRTHPEAARRRQLFVLDQLEEKREEYWPDITEAEIAAARDAEVVIVPVPERELVAAEVTSYARRILEDRVGEEAARRGGYTIHTTIDRALQEATRSALRSGLQAIDERQHRRLPLRAPRRAPAPLSAVESLRVGATYDGEVVGVDEEAGLIRLNVGGHEVVANGRDLTRFNPEGLGVREMVQDGARTRVSVQQLASTDDEPTPARGRLELGPEGAVVVIDARTRDLLALVGGYEEGPGFDRASRAVRQPGSTFKPFVYAAALRTRRYTPATIVIDAPGVYDDWRPDNFETWSFQGEIRLREALANSVNQVAVRLIEDVTPEVVVDFAHQVGIQTELDPTLALALGASGVRPIEMTNAYASFPAGGRWAPWRLVTRIEGPDGGVPLARQEHARDVMTRAEAYVLTSMLTSVVDHGTARRARSLRRPVAGKTGTSNDARDAWFIGFSPEVTAGVWVGYDDLRPLGRRENGGRSALPIWIEVMRAATEGRRAHDFARPSGVETALIDPRSGLLAYEGQEDALEEVFLEGTVPSERARPADVLDADSFLMQQFGAPASNDEPDTEDGT